MENKKLKDRIRGSLIGGAIGDALGYPVEFIYPYSELQKCMAKVVSQDLIKPNGGQKILKTMALLLYPMIHR